MEVEHIQTVPEGAVVYRGGTKSENKQKDKAGVRASQTKTLFPFAPTSPSRKVCLIRFWRFSCRGSPAGVRTEVKTC